MWQGFLRDTALFRSITKRPRPYTLVEAAAFGFCAPSLGASSHYEAWPLATIWYTPGRNVFRAPRQRRNNHEASDIRCWDWTSENKYPPIDPVLVLKGLLRL